jgi:hypothetical protein
MHQEYPRCRGTQSLTNTYRSLSACKDQSKEAPPLISGRSLASLAKLNRLRTTKTIGPRAAASQGLQYTSHSESSPSVPGQRRLAELDWVDSGAPVCCIRWLDAPGYLLALRYTQHGPHPLPWRRNPSLQCLLVWACQKRALTS